MIGRHTCKIEQIVNYFKGEATKSLIAGKLHPFSDLQDQGRLPKCWARGEWKVFLDNPTILETAIRYVEQNPVKEGKPKQNWSFVTSV